MKQLDKLEFEEQWRYRAGQGSNDKKHTVHALSAATRRLDKPEFEEQMRIAAGCLFMIDGLVVIIY